MLKILFVNPPGEFQNPVLPLGLASIAAYLQSKDADLEVSIIDAWAEKIGLPELAERTAQSQADIVGIYIASPRYDDSKQAIEACRKALPDSLIIAGGPHPSAVPEETLKDITQLDICCIGEGEETMYQLAQAVKNNTPLYQVDGIALRNKKNGEIIFTNARSFIENLDSLPFPARELFPLDKYKVQPPLGRKKPYFSMITSRGCPYQCAFCTKAVFKTKYRARSAKNICDEIEYLISKYGAKEIQFYDDDFTLDMKRAEEICDEILKRNIKIRWACSTRVDQISENLLKKMKAAGCWHVMYGVESGNQKILDSIKKGFTVEQIIKAFELTRKIGMQTFCSVIYGLPGETKETLKETFDLVKKLRPNFYSGGSLRIFPGSYIFESIKKGEYTGKTRTLNKDEGLTIGFFVKGNYTVLDDSISFQETNEIAKKALRSFYLSPGYIWQSLISLRSPRDLKYFLTGGFEVLRLLISK